MRTHRFEVLAFLAVILAAAALFVAFQSSVRAERAASAAQLKIPSTFNYQGILYNPDGTRVTGVHDLTIRVYAEAGGGQVLHQENFSGVAVRDGLFNVVLGDNAPVDPSLFAENAPLYLGISIDNGNELIPRQRIHPVPWALIATSLAMDNGAVITGYGQDGARIGNPDSDYIVTTSTGTVINTKTTINGKTTIDGSLQVTDAFYTEAAGTSVAGRLTVGDELFIWTGSQRVKPILVRRYNFKQSYAKFHFDTGISATDYTCSFGGWTQRFDISEDANSWWGRHLNVSGNTWWLYYETADTQRRGPPQVVIVCFRNELATYEVLDNFVP